MVPTLFIISIISFIIIVLPPGDFLTRYVTEMEQQGVTIADTQQRIEYLREFYGLDDPVVVQYWKWISHAVQGNFGYSFAQSASVADLIWERLALTVFVALASLAFTWVVAFPIGFYSAIRQHSLGDYFFTFLGFLGLATPNFMLALILMYVGYNWFGVSVGGLFSMQYLNAPWSFAKFLDLLQHIWVPMVVVGTAGTAGLIRVLRNNLLDELKKPYVIMARAKGLDEYRLILKYPVKLAINPFISTVGWILPTLFSGAAITSVVLNLPTSGALLLEALMWQDMYLAGAILLMLAVLTVVGTLLSDILLAAVDPRIRYE
jgi:peptide/nickel transport system permease protein